jgi:hypothetical protein
LSEKYDKRAKGASIMTLAADLAHGTLERIVGHFSLREHGNPYLPLQSRMNGASVGALRLFSGGPLSKLVYIGLTVPFIGLDSHMVYGFTGAATATPHFTLDAVCNGDTYAFHLDLTPRLDLGAHLAYINAAFQPLNDTFAAAKQLDGLTPAHISPRQYALMSPWMLVSRATPEAFAQINPFVDRYLNHWFDLCAQGIPPATYDDLTPDALAARDKNNRAAIFDPEVDPVWAQVDRLLGAEVSLRLRRILQTAALEE